MLKHILIATFVAASLGASAMADNAKPTDQQIAHIAYTAGQIDVTAAEQALKKARMPKSSHSRKSWNATTRRSMNGRWHSSRS